ncbi:hypothetical protein H5J24_18985 [Chryseobacterium capnotolerans]|uniref:hypothetical protein n=1 Tax=Chryseobacterium capnotolerans TaxID=2759528 RepID=UPI001E5AC9AF|nr:hypothetical protein [Chryseobacterium capnotolerans]UHO37709.1 hypothetical protein H5J24_18985 [Chryseobacterium capnotolerans]
MEFHDVNTELQDIQEKIKIVEQEAQHLQQQETAIEKILDRKKIFDEQLISEQKVLQQIQKDIESHLQQFIWKQFSPDHEDDFEKKDRILFPWKKD